MDALDLGSDSFRLRRRSKQHRDVEVSFIYTQLESGLLCCRFIRNARVIPDTKRAAYLAYARKALHDADGAMWRLQLSHPEFDQMMALGERLGFELDILQKD